MPWKRELIAGKWPILQTLKNNDTGHVYTRVVYELERPFLEAYIGSSR